MGVKKPSKKPRLHLHRDEKIGSGLKVLAKLHLEKALSELQGDHISPAAVHHVRTTIKKIASIIQLASPALGGGGG